jgi:hypothetical protein
VPELGTFAMRGIFLTENGVLGFVVVETPFYLRAVYIHSANWCEDWVLWLGEGRSVVPFRSLGLGAWWGVGE